MSDPEAEPTAEDLQAVLEFALVMRRSALEEYERYLEVWQYWDGRVQYVRRKINEQEKANE